MSYLTAITLKLPPFLVGFFAGIIATAIYIAYSDFNWYW